MEEEKAKTQVVTPVPTNSTDTGNQKNETKQDD